MRFGSVNDTKALVCSFYPLRLTTEKKNIAGNLQGKYPDFEIEPWRNEYTGNAESETSPINIRVICIIKAWQIKFKY